MAKKQNLIDIKIEKNVQPVRIFGINFEISKGLKKRTKQAANLKKIMADIEDYEKETTSLTESGDIDGITSAIEKLEGKIKAIVDEMLGNGAFEKLYKAADDDIDTVIAGLVSFSQQFAMMNTKQKMQSYIDGKKR